MKALITGFDPFGGETMNPSYEIVKLLPDNIEGCDIIKKEIPTVFGKSLDLLLGYIEFEQPDFVICLGQAGGDAAIRLEKVAINLNDARLPDNEGNQPIDLPVIEKSENAYFSNLPLKVIMKQLKENGIPTTISYTAGTYVCNQIFYGLMDYIYKTNRSMFGGFIHVPYLPDQVIDKKNTSHMALSMMVDAVTTSVELLVKELKTV